MIRKIAFTAYPCADVKRTREWYEFALGLSFAGAYAEDGVERTGRAPGSASGVTFDVDNVDEAAAALREKGVERLEFEETARCKMASLYDPEGDKITLHQRK